MRASFIGLAFLAALGGCDGLYGACDGLLGECAEPFTPDEGAWVGTIDVWSDACAEPLWTGDGWTLDGTEATFAFTPVDVDPADCQRKDWDYSCTATRPDGIVVTHAGEFLAGSEAVGTVTLTSAECTATANLALMAGWRAVADGPNAGNPVQEWLNTLFGGDGGNGYTPGVCPRDYDDHEQAECADGMVDILFDNQTDEVLSLFQAGAYYGDLPVGAFSFSACVGAIYAVGTGWEEEECLWTFLVEEDTSTLVYPPP